MKEKKILQPKDRFTDKTQSTEVSDKNDNQTKCELDDDLLEGVSGGLVQLVNPSSSRL